MKSFNCALLESKQTEIKKRNTRIDLERKLIVESIKSYYNIEDFKSLNNKDKKKYKSLILEMWSPTKGINNTGVKFVNESEVILTKESTGKDVVHFIEKYVNKNINSFVTVLTDKEKFGTVINKLSANISKMTGKKIDSKVLANKVIELIQPSFKSNLIKSI
mgnify:CR=1 FL=1